jgi:type I restriction enzyme S subunit
MRTGAIKRNRINEGIGVFSPEFYLNKGKKTISDTIEKGYPFEPLSKLTNKIYQGGIFKRVFVEENPNALKYITASDMVKANPHEGAKFLSRKYTPWIEEMTLRDKQILVSCAGTLGNIVLVNNSFEGLIGSQEIIRIETTSIPYGYLYAYLSSSIINSYIQSMAYGAVVPRISPVELGNLPVLLLPPDQQQRIHELIVQAAELRVEGNRQIKELRRELSDKLKKITGSILENRIKYQRVSIKDVLMNECRFDGAYNADEGRQIYNKIIKLDHIDVSSISEVFHPILFGKKQLKGSENRGEPMFKSSSMMKLQPETDFWLSKRMKDRYAKLQVKEGWVLISRTGTVGNVVRISPRWSGIYIDDHMIRVIPKEQYSGLLYVYLTTSLGKSLIMFQKYGTVQDVINSEYIGRIPIPKEFLKDNFVERMQEGVLSAFVKFDTATEKEHQAITLIETEIASWQS